MSDIFPTIKEWHLPSPILAGRWQIPFIPDGGGSEGYISDANDVLGIDQMGYQYGPPDAH